MSGTQDKFSVLDRKFESEEIPDLWADDGAKTSYRLSAANIASMPNDTKDVDALRRKLSELFANRLDSNYAKLEANCDIKRDTFQKVLKHRNGRNVTSQLLAKFCVGASLSSDEAKELFGYLGYELNERNRFDYILLCELNNKGNIVDFDEDLTRYGYPGVL